MNLHELKTKYGLTQLTVAEWSGVVQPVVSLYQRNPELVSPKQKAKIETALAEIEYLALTVLPEMQLALPGLTLNLRNVPDSKRFLAEARRHIEQDSAQQFLVELQKAQEAQDVIV